DLNHHNIVAAIDAQVSRVVDQVGGRMLGHNLKPVQLGTAGDLDQRTVHFVRHRLAVCGGLPSSKRDSHQRHGNLSGCFFAAAEIIVPSGAGGAANNFKTAEGLP